MNIVLASVEIKWHKITIDLTQYYMIWHDSDPDVTSKILQHVNTVHPSVASPTLIVLGVAHCRHCRQWLPVNIHSILWTETLQTGGIGVRHFQFNFWLPSLGQCSPGNLRPHWTATCILPLWISARPDQNDKNWMAFHVTISCLVASSQAV